MVWIVEWTQPNQGECNITAYASEKDALKAACTDLLDEVNTNWDMADEDILEVAKEINSHAGMRDYKSALLSYNEFQNDNSDYEYIQFWHVYERNLISSANIPEPALMVFADPDEEEEEDEEEDEEEEDEAYMATDPGATCRGPCGNFSPDAYADKQDGTFCCFQCKLMSQAFGGKSP